MARDASRPGLTVLVMAASAVTALAVVDAAALGDRRSPPLLESTDCEPAERNAKLSVPSALLWSTEGWA